MKFCIWNKDSVSLYYWFIYRLTLKKTVAHEHITMIPLWTTKKQIHPVCVHHVNDSCQISHTRIHTRSLINVRKEASQSKALSSFVLIKDFPKCDSVEKVLILFCCLLPEDKAPVCLTSSSLTYLQHRSQSLIHLITLLLPSTRQLAKGPPNPFMLGARTLRHHVSTTKGERENLLERLPDGSSQSSAPPKTEKSQNN